MPSPKERLSQERHDELRQICMGSSSSSSNNSAQKTKTTKTTINAQSSLSKPSPHDDDGDGSDDDNEDDNEDDDPVASALLAQLQQSEPPWSATLAADTTPVLITPHHHHSKKSSWTHPEKERKAPAPEQQPQQDRPASDKEPEDQEESNEVADDLTTPCHPKRHESKEARTSNESTNNDQNQQEVQEVQEVEEEKRRPDKGKDDNHDDTTKDSSSSSSSISGSLETRPQSREDQQIQEDASSCPNQDDSGDDNGNAVDAENVDDDHSDHEDGHDEGNENDKENDDDDDNNEMDTDETKPSEDLATSDHNKSVAILVEPTNSNPATTQDSKKPQVHVWSDARSDDPDESQDALPPKDTVKQPITSKAIQPKVSSSSRRKTKTPSKTGSSTPASSLPLSEERQVQLAKYQSMIESYTPKAQEWLHKCIQQQDNMTNYSSSVPPPADVNQDAWDPSVFPDFAIQQLCVRVEGQSLPLPALASQLAKEMNQVYDTDCFQEAAIADKIKLVATRKNQVKSPGIIVVSTEESNNDLEAPIVDPMTDERTEFVWRWEVDTPELLPNECQAQVKKDRAALKKSSTRYNTVARLLSLLSEADKVIVSNKKNSQTKLDKRAARIQQEEEKIVAWEKGDQETTAKRQRYSQEQEFKDRKRDEQNKLKRQLAEEKKRQKMEAAMEKQQKQEELAKERQQKKEEAELKKQAALQAKQRKDEEEQKAQQEKQAKLEKQANLMKSFFGPAKKVVKTRTTNLLAASLSVPSESLPKNPVISLISGRADKDVPSIFPMRLSKRANDLLRPRSSWVERTVFVTAAPENDDPWAAEQPFAEERTVNFRSLFKFLSFDTDVRPPYYGTWSKKSQWVTGRRPFGKDPQYLDYDYDSEAEWEEGDDELGEDLGDNDDMDVEKDVDGMEYDKDEDGWLAADDEVDNDDDLDEETKRLRKKLRVQDRTNTTLLLIGPALGGIPWTATKDHGDWKRRMEGVESKEQALQILQTHQVVTVQKREYNLDDTLLDAFPPALTEEISADDNPHQNNNHSPSTADGKPRILFGDDLKEFVHGVHNCTLSSKEKVVDQLRNSNERLAKNWSRAQTLKTLESVAEKTKLAFGCLWQVKPDVLQSCGLVAASSSTTTATTTLEQQPPDGPQGSAPIMMPPASDHSEQLQKEYLRRMARRLHHSTATSKEKLADELLTACIHDKNNNNNSSSSLNHNNSSTVNSAVDSTLEEVLSNRVVSKAECLRLVEQLAQKCKTPHVYWQVKAQVQRELDLEDCLPQGPPPPPPPRQASTTTNTTIIEVAPVVVND
ncbi:hypothetical protein ACA910_003463 [Epithemia clementina (nom. ined.)]